MYEKIIVVTRKTRLEELVERFNTKAQAKFFIEHAGGNFSEYEKEHETYVQALDELRYSLNLGLKVHFIDRSFLPTYLFTRSDLIVALGQDGLVANTAKYVGEQPILGVNPDPQRYDGILVPLKLQDVKRHIDMAVSATAAIASVTLAEASLNDGQRLLAFNDLYIGVKSHTSARYQISFSGQSESQSSSGIIVSTGAGSTGWLSSIFNMVASINYAYSSVSTSAPQIAWDADSLVFVVREPFQSKHSGASIVLGCIENDIKLVVESQIPDGGTIFSDGVESDFLQFNSGAIVTIGVADRQAQLVVNKTKPHDTRATSYSHRSNQRSRYSALGTSR